MATITAANLDQFIRLARTANVLVYTRQNNNSFTAFALPLDASITVTSAQLETLRAQLPSLEEVPSVGI